MAEKVDLTKMFEKVEIKPIPNLQAELLPCPLCGEEVSVDREYIFCDYCHLICRIDNRIYNGEAETYQEARQQAIDCWNTRTSKERGGGEVKYKNSVAIVRTRKGNTVGCKMIATYRYAKLNKNQFVYDKDYMCKDFEIVETVGGQVIVKTTDKFEFSKAKITNRIVFDNVIDIEILTHHDI